MVLTVTVGADASQPAWPIRRGHSRGERRGFRRRRLEPGVILLYQKEGYTTPSTLGCRGFHRPTTLPKMKIVIVSHGSFNPVHLGHLEMMIRARQALTAAGHEVSIDATSHGRVRHGRVPHRVRFCTMVTW